MKNVVYVSVSLRSSRTRTKKKPVLRLSEPLKVDFSFIFFCSVIYTSKLKDLFRSAKDISLYKSYVCNDLPEPPFRRWSTRLEGPWISFLNKEKMRCSRTIPFFKLKITLVNRVLSFIIKYAIIILRDARFQSWEMSSRHSRLIQSQSCTSRNKAIFIKVMRGASFVFFDRHLLYCLLFLLYVFQFFYCNSYICGLMADVHIRI